MSINKFFRKKGVSPIVASVLLVVITIAIGATTMAFLRSLTNTNLEKTKEQSAKISCGSDVTLEIPIVRDRYKICINETLSGSNGTSRMEVLFHNVGTKDVSGFSVTEIYSNGSVVTTPYDSTTYQLLRDEFNTVTFNFAGNTTNIAQFRIEPLIRSDPGKEYTVCTDSAVVRDSDEVVACT